MVPISQLIIEIELGIEIGIDPCPGWRLALMVRSNIAPELCPHPNNSAALPGFSSPNPITRSFDTEADSEPDPDLASPLTFSDNV